MGAPGHGKCIVDGINGNSKRKLTLAAGRKGKPTDDQNLQRDSKKFSVFSMINDKAMSPADECKRILELDGSSLGVKSIVKHQKRETNRKIRKYHYWVRSPEEKLSALKYDSPEKFTDEKDGVLNMYHIYCCHQMGIQSVAFRRIPCNCEDCREQLRMPWKIGVPFKEQPRFQTVLNCKYRNYLSGKNKWYFFKLQQRARNSSNYQEHMDIEANSFRKNVRDMIGEEINAAIDEGNFGAVLCNDKAEKNGYYLVEWIGSSWTSQETRVLFCDAVYWNKIPRAPGWYTRSNPPHIETHELNHVISADLSMIPMSESNKLPNGCAKAVAKRMGAMKLSEDSHDFIMEEMFRREALEDIHSDSSSSEDENDSSAESSGNRNSSISSSSEESE